MKETGTSRIEAFSDGVFAIAATLLVLAIGVPSGSANLGHELVHAWPSYLAYVASFLTIGIIWINHHHNMRVVGSFGRTFLNLLLPFDVAFIPFPTKLVADFLHKDGERAEDWREALGEIARGYRDASRKHPEIVMLFATRRFTSPP